MASAKAVTSSDNSTLGIFVHQQKTNNSDDTQQTKKKIENENKDIYTYVQIS